MEHTRIDEGVKRNSPSLPVPRKPPVSGKLGPDFDATTILEAYIQGYEIPEIADKIGVHPNALYYHLVRPANKDNWKAAQVAVSLAEKEQAKKEQREACDALGLARAREARVGAQWDLERLDSGTFGQQQAQINVNAQGPVSIQVVSFSQQSGAALPSLPFVSESAPEKPV